MLTRRSCAARFQAEEDESRPEESSRAEAAAGDAISPKAEEEGPAGGAYLRMLRAAIAHLAPTAALTTVWSWIKVCETPNPIPLVLVQGAQKSKPCYTPDLGSRCPKN